MKKFSKIFEGSSERKLAFWEEDLLNLSDIFLELQEKNICRLDFQAGYRTSSGSISYKCYLKDDKIEGNKDHVNHMIRVNSKALLRVSLLEINYKEGQPFTHTNTPSFFGGDVDIFLQLMKYIDMAKKRIPKYKLVERIIYLDFLENR